MHRTTHAVALVAVATTLLAALTIQCTGGPGNPTGGAGTSGTSGLGTSGTTGTSGTSATTSGSGGPIGTSGSAGTSGSSGTTPGQCIANGQPCGPKDDVCVGDCQGNTCCSKLCAGSTCTAPNVTFAATCPVASPCGGDPTGTWQFVGACLPGSCNGSGAFGASGTLKVAATGGDVSDVVFETDVHCGGNISTGGGHSVQGQWNADAGTLGNFYPYPYCVQGSSLYVFPNPTEWHETAVLEFRH